MSKTTGILLLNLGTPSTPTFCGVSKYLREFLCDSRVIELPALLRWLLVNLLIVPLRAKRVAHAYASIWLANGSPLLVNSQNLCTELQKIVSTEHIVVLGMRYGKPSIDDALKILQKKNVDQIIILPLFPQYASAVTGSALAEVLKSLSGASVVPACSIWSDFFDNPLYIEAMANSIKMSMIDTDEYLLFSYHGLPKRQLLAGNNCYREKCLQTATLIADKLQIPTDKWGISFQSRLGKLEWIKPYTDDMLVELRQLGVANLAVVCPSFIVDCLETIEEIGIRAAEQWHSLGGTNLRLLPCLNAQPHWIVALKAMLGV